MPKIDLNKLKQDLINIQNEINKILGTVDIALGLKTQAAELKAREAGKEFKEGEARVIEGVFDGQGMIGPDGKHYTVPANYASKSKLVEGDMLKLTIQPDGSFVFKQIGPVERERLVGVLAFDDQNNQFYGVVNGQSYLLLTASVTYFKGEVGDEVILLVPQGAKSKWAAVENIVKQLPVKEAAQKKLLSTEDKDGDKKENSTGTIPVFDEETDEFKIE